MLNAGKSKDYDVKKKSLVQLYSYKFNISYSNLNFGCEFKLFYKCFQNIFFYKSLLCCIY